MDSYITIQSHASAEVIIQKSRFIGIAQPCQSEEDALQFLDATRDQYRDAKHCCFAYIIGTNSGIMRYSDDGEPGGTAGLPIMEILKKKKIVNCCIAVVRYFGGILLGTGGLVRAYSSACKEALEQARMITMCSTVCDYCDLPYPVWDKFQHAAKQLPVRTEDVVYGASVSFHLLTRKEDHDSVIQSLLDASGRQLEYITEQEIFSPWELQSFPS